jgi:hypothetical protein
MDRRPRAYLKRIAAVGWREPCAILAHRRQVLPKAGAATELNRRARGAARPNRHAEDHDLGGSDLMKGRCPRLREGTGTVQADQASRFCRSCRRAPRPTPSTTSCMPTPSSGRQPSFIVGDRSQPRKCQTLPTFIPMPFRQDRRRVDTSTGSASAPTRLTPPTSWNDLPHLAAASAAAVLSL